MLKPRKQRLFSMFKRQRAENLADAGKIHFFLHPDAATDNLSRATLQAIRRPRLPVTASG
jgi:hypothetical protein